MFVETKESNKSDFHPSPYPKLNPTFNSHPVANSDLHLDLNIYIIAIPYYCYKNHLNFLSQICILIVIPIPIPYQLPSKSKSMNQIYN